jgi:hypothetical protein
MEDTYDDSMNQLIAGGYYSRIARSPLNKIRRCNMLRILFLISKPGMAWT